MRMKIPMILLLMLITINSVSAYQKTGQDDSLRIGDTAPSLKGRWVKGEPVQEFKNGMVYVLEFWATWCAPCIKAMPHLTELAKQHAGKATFIGVNIWEKGTVEEKIELVDKFVKEMGDQMGYSVCMDEADPYMHSRWLTAAGQSGIPTTMIVNQEGKLAWIGHPSKMDWPLAQIISGTFDSKAFAKEIEDFKNKGYKSMLAQMLLNRHTLTKDYEKAMTEYERLIAEDPYFVKPLAPYYYEALLYLDPDKTYAEAIRLKDSFEDASLLAEVFSKQVGIDKKFYAYAIDFYDAQIELVQNLPIISALYFNSGNLIKAAETQERWVENMKTFKDQESVAMLGGEIKRLKTYQAQSQLYQSYKASDKKIDDQFNLKNKELQSELSRKPALRDSIHALLNENLQLYTKNKKGLIASTIEANPDSYYSLSLIVLYTRANNEYDPEAHRLFNLLKPEVKRTLLGKKVDAKFNALPNLKIGGQAPDFTLKDVDGNQVNLSDYRGKVVLVEFWASWCTPCRAQNPHLLKAYETYKDKGFTIVNISIDAEKDKWLKAVQEDKLPWKNAIDRNKTFSTVADLYNVTLIPANYLLDKDGIILGKYLKGNDLHNKLKEVF